MSGWDYLTRADCNYALVGSELRVSPDSNYVSQVCANHSKLYPRNPIPFDAPTTNSALRKSAIGQVVQVSKVDTADNSVKVKLANNQETWFPIKALARPGTLTAAQGSASAFQAPSSITVSGAGAREVNGNYVRSGMEDGMPVYYNKQSPYDAWTGERIKIWYSAAWNEWRIGRSAFGGKRMHKYYVCMGGPSAISNPNGWVLPREMGLGQDQKPIRHPNSCLPAPHVTFPGQVTPQQQQLQQQQIMMQQQQMMMQQQQLHQQQMMMMQQQQQEQRMTMQQYNQNQMMNNMNMGMVGQPQMMMGGQPQMMMGGQPQMMMGGQPQMMMGGQPQMMMGGQPQMMMGGQPQMMMGGHQLFNQAMNY
eukprot:g3168.t1